jgi:hypothetical protein
MSDEKLGEQPPEENKISLGAIPLPDRTFEYDLAISDRYQNFSAELLRLSLAGIGAIGFLITNNFLGDKNSAIKSGLISYTSFNGFIFASLLFFGFSSLFALLHRYYGADSKAYHLIYLRLEQRNLTAKEKDTKRAKEEKEKRDKLFNVCHWLLILSAGCLWLGAMALIISFCLILSRNIL